MTKTLQGANSLETNSDINSNCLDARSMEDEMENLTHVSSELIRLREHTSDQPSINIWDKPLCSEQRTADIDQTYVLPSSFSQDSSASTTRTDINKFPQDSLHSFRFSSVTTTELAALRKRVMTRSIDFIKHSSQDGWKAPETLSDSYSTTSVPASMDRRRRNKVRSMGYTPPNRFCGTHHRNNGSSTSAYGLHQPKHQQIPPGRPRRCSLSCINEDTHAYPRNTSPSTRSLSSTSASSLSTSTSDSSSSSSPSSAPSSADIETATCSIDNTSVPKSTDYHNTTTTDGYDYDLHDDDLNYQQPSLAPFPHPALHNPTRFLPQNQAILTTYGDWRIILSNNIASLLFAGEGCSHSLVGKSVLDYVDISFRSRLQSIIKNRRRPERVHMEESAGGIVLVCGNVMPIVKEDGSKSSASLWLKEKANETGSCVYIWIFEEVFETVTHVSIDAKGSICYVDSGITDLLDYAPESLMGKPITTLIPSLSMNEGGDHDIKKHFWHDITHYKYFGCRTRLDAHLPIITKMLDTTPNNPFYTIRVTSIPMIAGLVTIRQNGIIEGCNDVFVKYLFGYSQEELVTGKKSMMDLIPQLPNLLQSLRRDDLLHHGIIISNTICRKLIADLDPPTSSTLDNNRRRLTHTPEGQILPVMIAVHRDGTELEIQLQLKLAEDSDDGVCALWITFDRDSTLSRVGHKVDGQALEIKQHNGSGLPTVQQSQWGIGDDHEDDDAEEDRLSSLARPNDTESQRHQQQQQQQQIHKVAPIDIPSKTSSDDTGYSSSFSTSKTHDTSDSSGTSSGGSLSVTRPSCDTDSPRVITSFSRPTFSLQPTSPLTPYSPVTFDGKKRSLAAHLTVSDYAAQTNKMCIDDYEILDEIGQGAYGLVKLAVLKKDVTQKKVVIKYVIKSRILVDCWTRDRKLGMVPAEIHILHTLRKIPHDNCGDMMDYFEDDDFYYIVMELHGAGMDLFDYIEFKDTMHESEIRSIFRQIAMAVRHLHTHKIVHRDIKDENVILDHNGNIRLIDFGSAAYIRPGRRYDAFVGTLDYAAPEILRGYTYEGPPQDVWALGILLYTLIYRENPFYDIDEIMARELRVPFIFADGLPVDLIEKMLERDVAKRLTIHQVMEHPWLAQISVDP